MNLNRNTIEKTVEECEEGRTPTFFNDNVIRLKCECGNNTFNVYYVDDYETAMVCLKCGGLEVVHSG